MITKCPSKYESATGAMPVADLVAGKDAGHGKPVRKATGYVKPGSLVARRFGRRGSSLADKADGVRPDCVGGLRGRCCPTA